MLFRHMYNKLWPESADSHGYQIRVRNDSFDSAEQIKESIIGQNVIEVAIRQ